MLRSIAAAVLGGLSMLMGFVPGASAETTIFSQPMQGPNRLDWCFDWSTGCGEQAAIAWCVAQGYTGATQWHIDNDIGASQPTRLINTGAVCDQGYCDGFADITCTRPDQTQVYNSPMQGPNRLDWCYAWGEGCGEQAAVAWCQAQGFAGATEWHIASDIGGSQPTRVFSTGAVCDADFCDGFADITCTH